MSDTRTFTLKFGQSAEAFGVTFTFNGGSEMGFAGGAPPQGLILLGVAHAGQTENVTLIGEDDWKRPREAFGVTYRVLTPHQLRPRTIEIEVAPQAAS